MKPRLLDMGCGSGGCSVGYARAGFDVDGVDLIHHPDYPFTMTVGDMLTFPLDGYDAIHASPPCPLWSTITPAHTRDQHPDLLEPMLARLQAWGGIYVVENVPGAPLPDAVLVCAQAMGLRQVRRHRLFSSNVPLMSPGCACTGVPFGIYGDHGDKNGPVPRPNGTSRGVKARDAQHARELLGIDWMTEWDDLADAIPPVMTAFIGEQLLEHLAVAA